MSAATSSRLAAAPAAAPGRRRMLGALAAAVLLSLALHLGLHLGLLVPPRAPSLAGATDRGAQAGAPRPAASVRLLQAPVPAAATVAAPATASPPPAAAAEALEQVLADPTRALDVAPAAGPAAPRTGAGTASPVAGPSAQAYLASEDVDEPAAPVADWRVLRDETTAGRVFDFAARIFVARDGSIDRVELLEPAPVRAQPLPPQAALQAMLDELQRTPMRPARLQGRAVASVRTIGFRIEVERDVF